AGCQPRHSIEVVSFSCEESSRFGRGTVGSGLLAGVWEADDVLALRDRNGVTLRRILERAGLDPGASHALRRQPGDYLAFLEIHIEQGRVLEEEGLQVGVAEAIAAPTRRTAATGTARPRKVAPPHVPGLLTGSDRALE
ncbi:MAG TPA: hypothetical protein PKC77_15630, partial [Sphingopyxis sp.]|nr:hypothetical protein [Sphingopyxis sp.]